MIIECPTCATRYEIPDGAIGSAGRNVRCAKCRHSWLAIGAADLETEADPRFSEAAVTDRPSAGHERSARAGRLVDAQQEEQPIGEAEARDRGRPANGPTAAMPGTAGLVDEDADVEAEPLFEPRRSRRLWIWAAVILAVMIAAAIAAMTLLGPPDWMPGGRQAFAAQPDLVLDFPDDQQGMRQLPNGTEFFGASGTITNKGSTTKRVPPILVVLRDSRERIVYSFEVVPPKHSLAPGESVAVTEAVTEVPRSARVADIGWKPG